MYLSSVFFGVTSLLVGVLFELLVSVIDKSL
jgi:hypothetical protein